MDLTLEKTEETVIFDSRIQVHTNEYADELRDEINKNVRGYKARIEQDNPRVVIKEREL